MNSTTNNERAATPRGTGAASTINTETIPHCRRSGQGVSRLDFFRGCALAGIIAASKNRRQVFSACVADDCDTAQMADMLARTMLRRAYPFGGAGQ